MTCSRASFWTSHFNHWAHRSVSRDRTFNPVQSVWWADLNFPRLSFGCNPQVWETQSQTLTAHSNKRESLKKRQVCGTPATTPESLEPKHQHPFLKSCSDNSNMEWGPRAAKLVKPEGLAVGDSQDKLKQGPACCGGSVWGWRVRAATQLLLHILLP